MNSVCTGTIVDMVTFCSWLCCRLQQCSNLQIVTAYLFSIIIAVSLAHYLHLHPPHKCLHARTVSLQRVQLVWMCLYECVLRLPCGRILHRMSSSATLATWEPEGRAMASRGNPDLGDESGERSARPRLVSSARNSYNKCIL